MLLCGGVAHLQQLIVVAVERIQSICEVANNTQQSHSLIPRNRLCCQHVAHYGDRALQLLQLLGLGIVVDGIALDQILFQHTVGPYAELSATQRFNSVADRDDYIKVVVHCVIILHGIVTHIYHLMCNFCTRGILLQLALFINIRYMPTYY